MKELIWDVTSSISYSQEWLDSEADFEPRRLCRFFVDSQAGRILLERRSDISDVQRIFDKHRECKPQQHICFWSFLSAVCKINFQGKYSTSSRQWNIQNIKRATKPKEFHRGQRESFWLGLKGQTFLHPPFLFDFIQFTYFVSWSVDFYMPPSQM